MAHLPDTEALRHVVMGWAKENHVSHGPLARMMNEISEELLTVRENGSAKAPSIPTKGIICNGSWSPHGAMAWRSLWLESHQIFLEGHYAGGSINVAQWLAIVQTIQGLDNLRVTDATIYSDSYVATKWVREKQFRTSADVPTWIEDLARLFNTTDFPLRERVQWWNSEVWGKPPGSFAGKDYRQQWEVR